jgi:hypothetical protein
MFWKKKTTKTNKSTSGRYVIVSAGKEYSALDFNKSTITDKDRWNAVVDRVMNEYREAWEELSDS